MTLSFRRWAFLNLLCLSYFPIFCSAQEITNLEAQDIKLVLPIAHSYTVDDVLISPDHTLMISSTSQDVKVWEMRSRRLKYSLGKNKIPFHSGKNIFSKNGDKFLTISGFNTLAVWNAADGKQVLDIKGEGKYLVSANFANSNNDIVAAYDDGEVVIWDGSDGKKKSIVSKSKESLVEAFYSFDDSLIIESRYSKIYVYRIADKKLIYAIEPPSLRGKVSKRLALSDDNRFLFATTYDSSIIIWDRKVMEYVEVLKNGYSDIALSESGKTIAVIEHDSLKVFKGGDLAMPTLSIKVTRYARVDLSPDGNGVLLSLDGSLGGTVVKLYNTRDTIPEFSFQVTYNIKKPAFSNNGDYIIAEDKDKNGASTLNLYSVKDGRKYGSFNHEISHPVYDLVPIKNSDVVITTSADSIVRVWGMSDAKIANVFQGSYGDGSYTLTEKYVINIQSAVEYENSDTVIIREAATGQFIRKMIPHTNGSMKSFVSPDGKYLVLDGHSSGPIVFDFHSGQKICSFPRFINFIDKIQFIPSTNKVATTSELIGSIIQIWDIKTGKLFFTIDYPEENLNDSWIQEFSIRSDGKYLATACNDNYLKIWDLSKKSLAKAIKDSLPFYSCQFSPDLKYLAGGMKDGSLVIVDMSDLSVKKHLRPHESMIYKIDYTDDGKYMLTASHDGTLKVWDMQTLEIISTIETGNAQFKCMRNGKIYCVDNAEVSVFDFNTGNPLYSFAALFEKGSLFLLPDKFYKATPDVTRFISWRKKEMLYGFEQFDIQYNRPDIVLEKLGNRDTSLIESYRKAYEKRLKRLSVDSSAFSSAFNVPVTEITNREEIRYEQTADKLTLKIHGEDKLSKLDHFNIWINEVPLFGSRGFKLKDRQIKIFDTVITVPLADSINIIESSVINVKGIESFRRPLEVRYKPEKENKGKTYFIGIGINRFAESGHDLSWSVKDIRDLASALKIKIKDFVILDTIFDERVSLEYIKNLKTKLMKTSINDKVIVAYSGHGLLSRNFDYYLSAFHTEFGKPEQKSIPYDEMEDLLDGIPARKKLLLIDACHSGEVDKEEMARMKQVSDSLNPSHKGGTVLVDTSNKRMGLKSSFELMQEIFVNVGRGTGATIISAAGGMQFALEYGDLKNGVFTYSILEAMKKYESITVSELGKIVGERVEQVTHGLQKPTSRREVILSDWEVW